MVLEIVWVCLRCVYEFVIWSEWIWVYISSEELYDRGVEMWRSLFKLVIYRIIIEFICGENIDFEVYGVGWRKYYLIKFGF